jgi:hypothetical protein
MTIWPKPEGLEGKAEIYLKWKNLFMIAIVILLPLVIALFLESLILKIICWVISLIMYIIYLRFQGPCITALAVGALPWYIYFEWETSPRWLFAIAVIVSLLEISYIRHRMALIKEIREKENIVLNDR